MKTLLTPSAAYGCIDLLKAIDRQSLNTQQILTLILGACQTQEILQQTHNLNLIAENNDGTFRVTEKGKACLEKQETVSQLRYLLNDYLSKQDDPWLQLARRGRLNVLLKAPPAITQLLHEAELADGDDDETVNFWDELAERLRADRNKENVATGRIGEKLTMKLEAQRTGQKPEWMALNGNHFGYDVLSRISATDGTLLKIEVKCSLNNLLRASFHVTRHEWHTAEMSNYYQFHLWSLQGGLKQLAVLHASVIAPHIPVNRNSGIWESVEIPFAAFQDHFANCPP
jgi:hypothetical protein